MTAKQYRGLRLALVLALVLSLGLSLTQSAYAQDVKYGDTVPQGVTVDNDIVLYGDQVTIEGDVLGDVVAVSKQVTVNGKIQGSLVALGETIDVGGTISGTVYASGVNLTLEPQAAIQHNLFFLGVSLATQPESSIGRDLYAVSIGARLAGQVGRNTTAVIGLVEIVKTILQVFNVQIGAQLPDLARFQYQPAGTVAGLLPAVWVNASGLDRSEMSGLKIERSQPEKDSTPAEQTGKWALNRLRELVGLLAIGLFMIWLFPARLSMWSERARARPLRSAGSGIVTLITGFAATAIFVVVIAGIALGLNALTLQNLAFIFGTLGLLAIGLAFFVFWLFAAYISKVIVAYLVGRLILKRILPKAKGRFWPLLVGVVLYVLVTAIPYAGWIIGFFVTLVGLGAVWLVYIDWRSVSQEAVPVEPEQVAAETSAETPADATPEAPPEVSSEDQ